MKQYLYKNRLLSICNALVGIGLLSLSSCDKDKVFTTPGSENQLITSIKLDVSSTLPLAIGMDSALVYSISPENPTNPEVLWTSSDESIATVTQDGIVTGINAGDAIITVSPAIGFGPDDAIKSVKVHVIPEITKATTIKFINTETEIYATDKLQLNYNILPENHTYDYLTWESSDKSIATVSETGLVSGIKPGNVTITAYTHDNSGVKAHYDLLIKEYIAVNSVTIQPYDEPLCMNQPVTLNVTYTPENGTLGSVDWTSSDGNIAKVDKGVITPTGFGIVTITATCKSNGSQASVTINIPAGWYKWDATDGFNGWKISTSGTTYKIEDGKMVVNMKKQGNGSWRGDFQYNGSPKSFHAGLYPILAIKCTVPKGGRNTLDAVASDGSVSGGYVPNTELTSKDAKRVLYFDMSQGWNGKMPKTGLTEFKTYQIKIADIPAANSEDGVYEIYWCRTFKNLTDLEDFLNKE